MKTTQLPRRLLLSALLLPALAAPASVRGAAADTPFAPAVTVVQPAVGKLPPDFKPSPALQPLITLVQSGVSEEVLLAYLASAGTRIALTPEEIIFLRDLGVSDAVITQLLGAPAPADAGAAAPAPPVLTNAVAPAAAPAVAAMDAAPPAPVGAQPELVVPPAQPVTTNQFVEALAPYGNWVNVDGYGLAWQPTVVVVNQTWRPYADCGRWVWSNCGWYWTSDYSWGWAPFHYGRWVSHPSYRWVWCPDTTWGPSWVSWRYSPSYCGWAPLPPAATYRTGVGFSYRSQSVGIHFEFGLGARDYCYVPTPKFCHPRPVTCAVPYDRVHAVHQTTSVVNNYIHNEHNVVINRGISPDAVALISKTEVPRVEVVPGRIGTGRGTQTDAGAGRQFPDGTRLTGGRPARVGGRDAIVSTTGSAARAGLGSPVATPVGSVRAGLPPGGRGDTRVAGSSGQTVHTVTRGPEGIRPHSRPERVTSAPVTTANTTATQPAPTPTPLPASPAPAAGTPSSTSENATQVPGRIGRQGGSETVLVSPQGSRYVPPSPMVVNRPAVDARLSGLSPRGSSAPVASRPSASAPQNTPSAPVPSVSSTPQVPRPTLPVTATSPRVSSPSVPVVSVRPPTVDARLSNLSPRPAPVPVPAPAASPVRVQTPAPVAPAPSSLPVRSTTVSANLRSLSPPPAGSRSFQPGSSLERFRSTFPSAAQFNPGGQGRATGLNGGSRFVPPTPATGQ
jgi:hypothetical protein